MHPFPLSLSTVTANTTLIHTYLYFIYLFVCRSLHKQMQRILRSFLCLCFYSSFQCFVWLYIRFRSVSLSLSLSSSTDPPHPHFTTQNRWLPHSLIFLFFNFQKFFVEKCGIIYLHLLCVYVGNGYLHLVVVCVELDWCLELVVCVEFVCCVEF